MVNEEDKKAPSLLDVTRSVLWGMLGVQKSKNYERDFTRGKPWQYVVVGLAAVTLFIICIVMVVKFALASAGV